MRTIAWDVELFHAPRPANEGGAGLLRNVLWLEDGVR
jgi:hypothetical protein